eukprot:3013072-Prymnesium_polylepis.1
MVLVGAARRPRDVMLRGDPEWEESRRLSVTTWLHSETLGHGVLVHAVPLRGWFVQPAQRVPCWPLPVGARVRSGTDQGADGAV